MNLSLYMLIGVMLIKNSVCFFKIRLGIITNGKIMTKSGKLSGKDAIIYI